MIRKLANWFFRAKLEASLDRELHYHLERRISDLERSGLAAAEARRQAKVELGGLTQIQEEVRDVWLSRWGRDLAYDLRFSLRSFFKTPSLLIPNDATIGKSDRKATLRYTRVHGMPRGEGRRAKKKNLPCRCRPDLPSEEERRVLDGLPPDAEAGIRLAEAKAEAES